MRAGSHLVNRAGLPRVRVELCAFARGMVDSAELPALSISHDPSEADEPADDRITCDYRFGRLRRTMQRARAVAVSCAGRS